MLIELYHVLPPPPTPEELAAIQEQLVYLYKKIQKKKKPSTSKKSKKVETPHEEEPQKPPPVDPILLKRLLLPVKEILDVKSDPINLTGTINVPIEYEEENEDETTGEKTKRIREPKINYSITIEYKDTSKPVEPPPEESPKAKGKSKTLQKKSKK